MVWLMFERLVWILFPVIVSITQFSDFWLMSYGNLKHILGVFSFHNSVFNGIFVIKTIYWVPLVLSFQLSLLSPFGLSFFFFSFTFLSFSLLLYLFFFRAKSSYSPTTHTLFFLFFLFCSSPTDHSHTDPCRPISLCPSPFPCRKAHIHQYIDEKSWEIISVNLRSHAEKLHHALVLLIAAIELVLRSGRSIKIGIHNNGGSPLETIRSGSSYVDTRNSSIGNDSIGSCYF